MYTVSKTIAKPLGLDNRWHEIDISRTPLIDIYSNYRQVYVILNDSVKGTEVSLDLEKIRNQYGIYPNTFTQLLTELGNKALPTTNKIPTLTNKFAKYQDAFKVGYKVYPGNSSKAFDADIPLGDKTSLYLKKDGIDFKEFAKYCMVAVNGYFHFVDVDANGAWVLDGMRSNFHCKKNLLGIVSFKELGTIKHKQITKKMLFKLDDEAGFRNLMGVDIGENINNKTVILVLGGYLHILDTNSFYQYNDRSIVINIGNLPLLERYHESRQYLDLSDLPVTISSLNDSAINVDDFYSEANLTAYATMKQSFIVLLDNNEIYTEREYVRTPPTPGLMISFKKPVYPLFHGVGKLGIYWSREDHGQWALRLEDNQWSRRWYDYVPRNGKIIVSDSENTMKPVYLSAGYFLKIGTDIKLT